MIGTLLSSSCGLSTFLIPYFLKTNTKLDTFFQKSSSSYENKNTEHFSEEENKQLSLLNPLFENLKLSKEKAQELKKIKDEIIEKTFQSIFEAEKQLISFYEENLKTLNDLDSISQELSKQTTEKINLLIELNLLENLVSLLLEIKKLISSQGELLSKFICIIEHSEQKEKNNSQNCEKLNPSWIAWEPKNTSLISNSDGGGQQISSNLSNSSGLEAKKTLNDIKEKLKKKREELIEEFYKNAQLRTNLISKEINLISIRNINNDVILKLNLLTEKFANRIKNLQNKSNSEIEKLNNLRQKLEKVYEELQNLKKNIIDLQYFEGKFKNSICNNTKNTNANICKLNFQNKK
ncbi:hypothetical protein [Mycoplasma parvum]|uniref:Uncharacterized protein n=1 Tax=Mycoplasma parvum str. Indiana TaxID=1403316 RepID=U5NBU3_9MOLU|nr:hypothetical protein [Mycoplasma parvum]AGX88852.1 hypothetical protein PRV_00385 [Mycoplasma parvum str. Indiana]